MNKVYKSVWNESIGAWVAVSENSPARGKRGRKLAKAALASAMSIGVVGGASATVSLDGGTVTAAASGIANGIAIGSGTDTTNDYGVAMGAGATASGVGDVAIGADVKVQSGAPGGDGGVIGGVAVGSNAKALAASTSSFGALAVSSGMQSTALGSHATATGVASTAIGMSAIADRDNTVSIGNSTTQRQLVQVAAGTRTNDAVNVSQLTPLVSALGGAATLNADGSVTGPTFSLKGTNYTNVGDALTALADSAGSSKYLHVNSTLADSLATGSESIAIGGAASSAQLGDISIGMSSKASGTTNGSNDGSLSAIAVGMNAAANAQSAMALGGGSLANNDSDIALGSGSIADSTGSTGGATAVGVSAKALNHLAVALGRSSTASADNSVALGAYSVADRANTVSVGSKTQLRQIANVGAGTFANDAVNVTQLQNVTTLLGGGAKVNADGTIQAPAYTVAGTSFGTVGDAITKVDTELTNKVAYDTTDKAHITLGGVGASKLVTISNLQIGDLSSTSTDAVNGSQLYSTNQRVGSLETFEGNVNNGGGIKYFHTNSTLADSSATGADSVAIGGATLSSGKNSVALGSNSVADRDNSVSVGAAGSERQVTNVAAGTASTDAVNVGQLNAVSSNVTSLSASAIKYDTNADGTPDYANATLGNGNTTGTALHNVAAATGNMDAVNLGQLNDMMGQVTNIANGAYNPLFTADGNRDTEVATSSGTHSVASGANAVASGANAIASGATSVASGTNSIAVGSNTSATANNAVAVGANASASANNSVALGAGSVADRANAVSVGSTAAGGQRQVTNVAAGTDGTDAVNVNQMQQSVNTGVKSAKGYTDALRSDMNSGLSLANNHINSVGAMSSAMAMMAGSAAAVADKDNRFAAGTGVYRNKAAIAVGFQKRFGTNMVITVGGSTTGEESTGGAGFAFGF
jgi:autotransporter adhesin